jgi:Fur family ferric uptake transcriptional regulator
VNRVPDAERPGHAPAAELLRGAGLRRTPVRLGVLEVLARAGGPLGVPQIIERLPDRTDAVTVYRTLNTFTRKRLVHRVHGEDRTWRYALSGSPLKSPAHQHPHFVCDECGTVECLAEATIPRTFVPSLRVGARYAVRYPEVVLHGLCPKCHD